MVLSPRFPEIVFGGMIRELRGVRGIRRGMIRRRPPRNRCERNNRNLFAFANKVV